MLSQMANGAPFVAARIVGVFAVMQQSQSCKTQTL